MRFLFYFILFFFISKFLLAITYKEAISYLNNANYSRAKKYFWLYYKNNSKNYKAPYSLYNYIKLLNNLNEIEHFLIILFKKYPNFPLLDKVFDDLGTLSYLKNSYNNTYNYYLFIIKRFKKSSLRSKAYYYMTLSLIFQKYFEKAIYYINQAFNENLETFYKEQLKFSLAKISFFKNDYKSAFNSFSFILKNTNNSFNKSSAMYLAGRSLFFLNKNFLSKKYFLDLLDYFPNSIESYFLIHTYKNIYDQKEKKYYYVQIGSFKDKNKAENLLSQIEFDNVFIQLDEKKKHLLYKVLVGPFFSYKKAKKFLFKIEKKNLLGWIFSKIN